MVKRLVLLQSSADLEIVLVFASAAWTVLLVNMILLHDTVCVSGA